MAALRSVRNAAGREPLRAASGGPMALLSLPDSHYTSRPGSRGPRCDAPSRCIRECVTSCCWNGRSSCKFAHWPAGGELQFKPASALAFGRMMMACEHHLRRLPAGRRKLGANTTAFESTSAPSGRAASCRRSPAFLSLDARGEHGMTCEARRRTRAQRVGHRRQRDVPQLLVPSGAEARRMTASERTGKRRQRSACGRLFAFVIESES